MSKLRPIIEHRTIIRLGTSYMLTLPKEWLRNHGITPKKGDQLLIVADKDIRIVNPEHEEAVYDEVTKIARNIR